jgi:hypothetical protein
VIQTQSVDDAVKLVFSKKTKFHPIISNSILRAWEKHNFPSRKQNMGKMKEKRLQAAHFAAKTIEILRANQNISENKLFLKENLQEKIRRRSIVSHRKTGELQRFLHELTKKAWHTQHFFPQRPAKPDKKYICKKY